MPEKLFGKGQNGLKTNGNKLFTNFRSSNSFALPHRVRGEGNDSDYYGDKNDISLRLHAETGTAHPQNPQMDSCQIIINI